MDEFYSTLKGIAVDEEEYNNSTLLYTLLKMRDMSDLNDLYNAQDVILFCEISENRFQVVFETSDLNPRKCNSASNLSGFVQRDQYKVSLALPTNNWIIETVEKTLTVGASCVSTQWPFDTKPFDEVFKAYKLDNLK